MLFDGQNGQPSGCVIQSEKTAESIHFVPPPTWRVSDGGSVAGQMGHGHLVERLDQPRFCCEGSVVICLCPITVWRPTMQPAHSVITRYPISALQPLAGERRKGN